MDIFEAVRSGDLENVKDVIRRQRKKVVNFADNHVRTPLHYATRSEKFEIVKFLLESGAHINAKESTGRTALHIACAMNENLEIAQILINKGADVNAEDHNKNKPLNYAVNNSIEMTDLLLRSDIDHQKDQNTRTLHSPKTSIFKQMLNFVGLQY